MKKNMKEFISFFIAGFLSGIISMYMINIKFIGCLLMGILCGFLFVMQFQVGSEKETPLSVKRFFKGCMLFIIGSAIYGSIEVAFRGRTHISMLICGGLCFVLIGLINELVTMSIVTQMVISSLIITGLEFVTGCVLNLWLHLDVWDYSNQAYNLLGQICLLFSNLWFLLSLVGIVVDDVIRHKLFNESYPKYYL